jgi:hypothetical protein
MVVIMCGDGIDDTRSESFNPYAYRSSWGANVADGAVWGDPSLQTTPIEQDMRAYQQSLDSQVPDIPNLYHEGYMTVRTSGPLIELLNPNQLL